MEEHSHSSQLQNGAAQVEEPKAKKKANKVLFVILVILLIAGAGLGGYLYASRTAQKEADASIADLQKQIDTLKAQNNSTTTLNPDELSQKDVDQIDKELTAQCNKDGDGYNYVVSKDGQTYTELTKQFFMEPPLEGSTPKYAKGFAVVSVGCQKTSDPDAGGGGYASILQRQEDGTWKQLLGVQDMLDCDTINRYKIPAEIQAECYKTGTDSESSKNLIKNTN